MSGQLGLTVGEASRQWIIVYIISGIILAAVFGFYLRDLGRKKICQQKRLRPPSGAARRLPRAPFHPGLRRRARRAP